MRVLFTASVILLFLSSCGGEGEHLPKFLYAKSEFFSCRDNASNTYYLARPENAGDPAVALLVILDPKGDGEAAAELFSRACDFAPFIIAAPASIANGTPDYEHRIDGVIGDVEARYGSFGGRIILCGFSGGARMAANYARSRQLRGVLMAGAGLPFELPSTPVFVVGGLQDFNFNEVYRRPEAFMLKNSLVLSDAHPGLHEWPRHQILRDGLLFISRKMSESGERAALARAVELTGEADSLANSHRYYLSWKCLEKAAKLGNEEVVKEAAERADEMLKSGEYRLEITSLENHLDLENRLRSHYSAGSISGDAAFWKEEIRRLEIMEENADQGQKDHIARVKAYLGILFYSRLKQIIFDPGKQDLAIILVNAFSLIEPENADLYYFKSVCQANAGRMDSASHFLALARQAGFRD